MTDLEKLNELQARHDEALAEYNQAMMNAVYHGNAVYEDITDDTLIISEDEYTDALADLNDFKKRMGHDTD